MAQIVLVGLGAGAASALLFASILSGTPLSIILAYLAPLPIMIAAIGWSHWAGLIAALAAALGLAAGLSSPLFIISFLVATGLPAWWLGYLALLGRANPDSSMEWYPASRLLLWCAAVSALMVLIIVPTFGMSEDSFRASLQGFFERAVNERNASGSSAGPSMTSDEIKRLVDNFITIMPPVTAGVSTLINVINLYLAARIVRVSGRLRRPWPDLTAIRFPPLAHGAFAVSFLLPMLPGILGMAGSVIWAVMIVAYAMVGVAVLHSLTQPLASRTFILSAFYLVAVFFWPVMIIVLALIAIADAAFNFRGRVGPGSPPTMIQ